MTEPTDLQLNLSVLLLSRGVRLQQLLGWSSGARADRVFKATQNIQLLNEPLLQIFQLVSPEERPALCTRHDKHLSETAAPSSRPGQ